MNAVRRAVVAAVMLIVANTLAAQYSYGYLPIYPSASLPPCTSEQLDRVIYNSTAKLVVRCDGAYITVYFWKRTA